MATSTEAPDPRTLKSWEDAFQYPIPTVRAMEKKLRSNNIENHDKLRSLVGASYRDLLGTARTIIEVNGQMQDVASLLKNAAKKTDSRQFDKLSQHCASYNEHVSEKTSRRYALASQASTLLSAIEYVAGLLKAKKYALLAAKLLVIARLLHKSVTQLQRATDDSRIPLKRLAFSIASLREKLLRQIDRRLSSANINVTLVVEDLTAFTLVTSSSPSDALTHFLHLRTDAVQRSLHQHGASIREVVHERLKLFFDTQSQSRNIFPDLLGASLRTLGARPLLLDDSILALDELKLDVHKRWFGEDICNFTPWTRHDELPRSKAAESLEAWTRNTFSILVEVVGQDVSPEMDIRVIASTRQEVLQAWLSSRRAVRSLDGRDTLLGLAQPFLERLKSVVAATAESIHTDVAATFRTAMNTIDHRANGTEPPHLWNPAIQRTEMSDGAIAFRQAIVDARTGRSSDVDPILRALTVRKTLVDSALAAIKAMRDIRWDDDYEDDEESDDHDVSALDILRHVQPDELINRLRSSVAEAVERLEKDLRADMTTVGSAAASRDRFLVRLYRALRAELSTMLLQIEPSTAYIVRFEQQIESVHQSLAHSVAIELGTKYWPALEKLARRPLYIQALWDGSPALPVQVSPPTFRYVRDMVQGMERAGPDLWTPDLVARLQYDIDHRVSMDIMRLQDLLCPYGISEGGDGDILPAVEGREPVVGSKTTSPGTDINGLGSVQTDAEEQGPQMNGNASPHQNDDESSAPVHEADDPSNPPDLSVTDCGDEASRRAKVAQVLFDVLYLQRALSVPTEPKLQQQDPMNSNMDDWLLNDKLVGRLRRQARLAQGGDDTAEFARLRKNFEEYWKRTYLLFGLLSR